MQCRIGNVVVLNGGDESETLSNGTFHYTVPYAGHPPRTVSDWLAANF